MLDKDSEKLSLAASAVNVMAPSSISTPISLFMTSLESDAAQRECTQGIAKVAGLTEKQLQERSKVIQNLAKYRAEKSMEDFSVMGSEAIGSTLAAIFIPGGPIVSFLAAGAGSVGGNIFANKFVRDCTTKISDFLTNTQKRIDKRMVSSEELFAHTILSLREPEMKQVMSKLRACSNGKIKDPVDLISVFAENPPSKMKIDAIHYVQSDKEINATIAAASGINISPLDKGVPISVKQAELLNKRPRNMQHITLLDPTSTFALTHNFNIFQKKYEQQAAGQQGALSSHEGPPKPFPAGGVEPPLKGKTKLHDSSRTQGA